MRLLLLPMLISLSGCHSFSKSERNGLSVEWSENRNGTKTALYVKRNGKIICEVGAVSNSHFIQTRGSDDLPDVLVSYYDDVSAKSPGSVLRNILYSDGSIEVISYNDKGQVETSKRVYPDNAQQDAAANP